MRKLMKALFVAGLLAIVVCGTAVAALQCFVPLCNDEQGAEAQYLSGLPGCVPGGGYNEYPGTGYSLQSQSASAVCFSTGDWQTLGEGSANCQYICQYTQTCTYCNTTTGGGCYTTTTTGIDQVWRQTNQGVTTECDDPSPGGGEQ